MKNYTYQNTLVGKKQLSQLLAWSFTNYDSMQACSLADELKYLGFRYATQAGISISIEDLKIPFVKNLMLEKANQEIFNSEKIYLKGKITDVERFQKLIDTWSLTSESLKDQIIYYFKNYDPLNSVYIMAFSGARGNLSQVRQLVGMRGLMSDPSGQIMNLPIKKNFREGLTITDYLMSGYGARKGIVDTALKTANSGYLTRRLIDVAQDILIREKDCLSNHAILLSNLNWNKNHDDIIYSKILGRILTKSIFDSKTKNLIAKYNTQISLKLIKKLKEKEVVKFYVRSPLTCNLYRAICQKCYGWDLANENLVDIGEAIGILAGQSIGEPGTQLTMRTFHTGGIFTSEARQQIISPVNGMIQFYKLLKTVILRTNRGEDVLITKNSGSLILIPKNKHQQIVQFEVLKNTIIFPKNNQYILKDTVIGERINQNKQIKTEIKPILSYSSGEVFIPRLKQKINLFHNNKLVWILAGQLYHSPLHSFLNFYPDYKLNPNSYVFRTKLLSHYHGFVNRINHKESLSQRLIKINNEIDFLTNAKLRKIQYLHDYSLQLNDLTYRLISNKKSFNNVVRMNFQKDFWILMTNSFKTLTGGIIYYDVQLKTHKTNTIYSRVNSNCSPSHRTIVWFGEEIYKVNCEKEKTNLLIEPGDFISKGFEFISGLFSKTSGFVTITQKNNNTKTILIKSGLVYEAKKCKNTNKKLYYPGEVIFNNIIIKELSFCEFISGKNKDQFIIQPLKIYEIPYLITPINKFHTKNFFIQQNIKYLYKSNQRIKGGKPIDLITNLNSLRFKNNQPTTNNKIEIRVFNHKTKNCINFNLIEKFVLNQYVLSNLKYKNIITCFLVQEKQFINNYATLGYLEAINFNSSEIVKIKVKQSNTKQILLISNHDCVIIKKQKILNKRVNDFVTTNFNTLGKIILENDTFFTIQKGRPYFFPNCKNEELNLNTNLQYKTLPNHIIDSSFNTKRDISLNYVNLFKLSIKKKSGFTSKVNSTISIKSEFSKLFLKTNGKLYSCLIPQFFKKFIIANKESNLQFQKLICSKNFQNLTLKQRSQTLLLQSSDLVSNNNKYKTVEKNSYQLLLLKFIEQPFKKSTKSVGLYSITEEYFEQEVNTIFCKNTEFVEIGKTIGFLNLEKEITGDIVQGLPRIEEILEARKKNIFVKRIPTSQKKGLVLQKPNLDINFEFKKLGSPIKENDKINPHKLLKAYFNYYGLLKVFVCDRNQLFKYHQFITNYEGAYKSFKKVQLFILSSVQDVYQSQGVTINDKHLEVIIKQMTTKVLVTYEGDTPLLRQEVLDLYHIHYINKILQNEAKQSACYIPLLLGITKAALNNPSFISAASFQETTRVLTKAAIEGRIDWLRGLKENIIIGNLIPAGTGSLNYRNSFRNYFIKTQSFKYNLNINDNIKKTSRQGS